MVMHRYEREQLSHAVEEIGACLNEARAIDLDAPSLENAARVGRLEARLENARGAIRLAVRELEAA